MNDTDLNKSKSPELSGIDVENISGIKVENITRAVKNGQESIYRQHPQLLEEAQAKFRIQEEERLRLLEMQQVSVNSVDNSPIYETEVNMLMDQQQEQQEMDQLAVESRKGIEDARPIPSDQVQVEALPVKHPLEQAEEVINDAVAQLPDDVRRALETRELENSGSGGPY